jgi:hypothetical protein
MGGERVRHGLFRCGAFLAARLHRPSISVRCSRNASEPTIRILGLMIDFSCIHRAARRAKPKKNGHPRKRRKCASDIASQCAVSAKLETPRSQGGAAIHSRSSGFRCGRRRSAARRIPAVLPLWKSILHCNRGLAAGLKELFSKKYHSK